MHATFLHNLLTSSPAPSRFDSAQVLLVSMASHRFVLMTPFRGFGLDGPSGCFVSISYIYSSLSSGLFVFSLSHSSIGSLPRAFFLFHPPLPI